MDSLTVAIRFGLYLDLMILFGTAAFHLYALPGSLIDRRRPGSPGMLLFVAGLAGVALSAFGLVALAASMAGMTVLTVDRASVSALLWGTSIGTAGVVRTLALLLALPCALLLPRSRGMALTGTALLGALALGSLAWSGHGVMDDGAIGWLHLGADIVHLFAAGLWVGALLGLLRLVMRQGGYDGTHLRRTHHALESFSRMGTLVVALILLSGLVNGWLLVGPAHVRDLLASPYGRLLAAKLVLFAAMLLFAATNRFRLTPALGTVTSGRPASLGALRASLVLETGAALAILGLVAWLGTLQPPVSGM